MIATVTARKSTDQHLAEEERGTSANEYATTAR
jgi:hypothetical protein